MIQDQAPLIALSNRSSVDSEDAGWVQVFDFEEVDEVDLKPEPVRSDWTNTLWECGVGTAKVFKWGGSMLKAGIEGTTEAGSGVLEFCGTVLELDKLQHERRQALRIAANSHKALEDLQTQQEQMFTERELARRRCEQAEMQLRMRNEENAEREAARLAELQRLQDEHSRMEADYKQRMEEVSKQQIEAAQKLEADRLEQARLEAAAREIQEERNRLEQELLQTQQRVQERLEAAEREQQERTKLEEELQEVQKQLQQAQVQRRDSESAPPLPAPPAPAASAALYGSLAEAVACTICMDTLVAAVTLSCSHSFCEECIDDWRATHSDCPTCRQPIASSIRSRQLDAIAEQICSADPDEAEDFRKRCNRWKELKRERCEWDVCSGDANADV